VEKRGSNPGISVSRVPPPAGQKAQKLELALLEGTGLTFLADDPADGGDESHGVIAPVNDAGRVDDQLLREWANGCGTGVQHRFTGAILKAIVEVVRS
jgi:hypothetical protein